MQCAHAQQQHHRTLNPTNTHLCLHLRWDNVGQAPHPSQALHQPSPPKLPAAAQEEETEAAPGMEIDDAEPPPGMEVDMEGNRPLDPSAAAAATAAAQLQYQRMQQQGGEGRWVEPGGVGGGEQAEVARPRVEAPHTLEFGPLFYHAPLSGEGA
eukprot:1160581-Pelagomonas_calceolata.AAC.2